MCTSKRGTNVPIQRCHRIYKSPAEYNRHLKKHSSSRPSSKCSVCDRSFKEKKYLDEHMKIHSDELTKECLHCGKKYRWRSSGSNSHQNKAPRFGQKER